MNKAQWERERDRLNMTQWPQNKWSVDNQHQAHALTRIQPDPIFSKGAVISWQLIYALSPLGQLLNPNN